MFYKKKWSTLEKAIKTTRKTQPAKGGGWGGAWSSTWTKEMIMIAKRTWTWGYLIRYVNKKNDQHQKMWSKPHKNLTYVMGDTWLGTWTKYFNKIKRGIQTKGTTWFGMWTK